MEIVTVKINANFCTLIVIIRYSKYLNSYYIIINLHTFLFYFFSKFFPFFIVIIIFHNLHFLLFQILLIKFQNHQNRCNLLNFHHNWKFPNFLAKYQNYLIENFDIFLILKFFLITLANFETHFKIIKIYTIFLDI